MIKLFPIRIYNSLLRIFKRHTKELAIFTSKEHLYKVKEDLMVEQYFLKNGVKAKLVAWEGYNRICKNNLIKSTWGYQRDIKRYLRFLDNIEGKLINSKELIRKNIEKYEQIKYLRENNIDCIDTVYVNKLEDLNEQITNEYKVVKPVISASSENTFKINLYNYSQYTEFFINSIENGYIVQPFIKEIENGEISVVIINGKISHYLNRFPGKFTERPMLKMVHELDNQIKALITKVTNCYVDAAYLRLDIVKVEEKYLVMEIEVIEPQLFFELFDNKKDLYINYVNEIKKHLN